MPQVRVTAAVLLATLMVVPAVRAAEDEVVVQWDFDKPGDLQGWSIDHDLDLLGVQDGLLRLHQTGADAYISSPPIDVPLNGSAVRIRMRANADGPTQLYWVTNDRKSFTEANMTRRWVSASKDFVTIELSPAPTAAGDEHLTGIRIDPYNLASDATIEIDWIAIVQKAPRFRVTLSSETACTDHGEVKVTTTITQTSGRVFEGSLDVHWPNAYSEQLHLTNGTATASTTVPIGGAGVHCVRCVVGLPNGEQEERTTLVTRVDDSLAARTVLQTSQYRLDLIPAAGSELYQAARLFVRNGGDPWRPAALLQPLVDIVVQDGEQTQQVLPMLDVNASPLDGSGVELRGAFHTARQRWTCALQFKREAIGRNEVLAITTELRGPGDGKVLRLAGPRVLIEAPLDVLLDRFGLFGGLEFLGPGDRSSGTVGIAPSIAERWTPPPYMITLPLMAIERDGLVTALLWDPLQPWLGKQNQPAATLASPNFLDGQPNHRMELSIPGVGSLRDNNEALAHSPVTLKDDDAITLSFTLFAGEGSVLDATKLWYTEYGVPEPPPAPHNDERTYELCVQNFGETMFCPSEKGWQSYWFRDDDPCHFDGFMAATLIGYGARTHKDAWVNAANLQDRKIIDILGRLAQRLQTPRNIKQLIAVQRDDGTWGFHNDANMIRMTKQFTGDEHDTLGEEGSTSLGTCVQQALPILRQALVTRDAECLAAGLKALEAMKQFRVPRGAQVWEVHKEIPDIRAAALAVEAYTIGYQLTNDARYLDEAADWAWAGVPFLYSWRVPMDRPVRALVNPNRENWRPLGGHPAADVFENPDRQITPYACIPVFGTSYYTVSWFGNVVQWCGIEWAQKVLGLMAFHHDKTLRRIADGALLSGQQQMLDKQPWVGLYPDVWVMETNTASGTFINASRILRGLQLNSTVPVDQEIWTRVLHRDVGPVHISGWGRCESIADAGNQMTVTQTFAPDQPCELLIVGLDAPKHVRIKSANGATAAGLVVQHHDAQRATVVTWTSTGQDRIALEW